MKRREFLHRSACAAGAISFHTSVFARRAFALAPLPRKFSASDTVTLGKTGIQTSRLAMGTGTIGSGHHSNQTALGIKGLSDLLLNGYDHGLRFFDSADSYGSHPHVAGALKHVPRDKSPSLPRPGRATPPPPAPTSTVSAANSALTTSTSASCTASPKETGPIATKV
jgi:hypothetical protein